MWSAPWGWRPGEYSAHRYLMSSYCVLGPRLDTGETVTKANKHLDFWGQRARGADDRQTCGEKDHFSGTWDPSVRCAPESTTLKAQHRCGTS